MATILTNNELKNKGRGGDKILAHLQPGEVVIPKSIAEDHKDEIKVIFSEGGAAIEEFTVGSSKNKVNPKTGFLEFFKVPFVKIPKPTLEQQVALDVQESGLGPATEAAAFVEKSFRTGGKFSRGILRLLGQSAKKRLEILGRMTPIPTPQNINISAQRKSEDIRRTRSRKGRRGTILTERGLGVVGIGKSTLLGGGR